jgi:hypothetical protein
MEDLPKMWEAPKPTLPQNAREGWDNRNSGIFERVGHPPVIPTGAAFQRKGSPHNVERAGDSLILLLIFDNNV